MTEENNENINHNNEPQIKIEAISENKIQIDQNDKTFGKENKRECEVWGNIHKLRYLLFIAKQKTKSEFTSLKQEKDYFQRMSACIDHSSYQYCRILHRQFLKKYENIQGIIDNFQEHLYFDQEMLRIENIRVDEFLKNYNQQLIRRISKPIEDNLQNNINDINADEIFEGQQEKQQTNEVLSFTGQFEIDENCTVLQSIKNITIPIEFLIVIKKSNSVKIQFQGVEKNKEIKNLQSEKQKRTEKSKRKMKRKNSKIKKMKEKKTQQKINQFGIKNQKSFSKVYKYKRIKKQARQSKRVYWSKPENIKLIIFLILNSELLNEFNLINKKQFFLKCSQYINTDKTPKKCDYRIDTLLKQYGMNFAKTIKGQVERLKISQELIKKERAKYILNLNKKLKCEINVKDISIQKLKLIQQSNSCSIIDQKVQLNYSIQFFQTNSLQNPTSISIENLSELGYKNLQNETDTNSSTLKLIKKIKIPEESFIQLKIKLKKDKLLQKQLVKESQNKTNKEQMLLIKKNEFIKFV